MILSASRRTDIPSFYSDWFFNRIREGYVLSRNPVNFRQVGNIRLTPDVVDAIVFWTKNPGPMLGRLGELDAYMYYFQFTITPYGKDIEPNIPSKVFGDAGIFDTFKRLSDAVGPDRVIWRYDPILINEKYSVEYHVNAFEKMARELGGHTRKVTISFIDDDYRGVKSNLSRLDLSGLPPDARIGLGARLSEIAHDAGLAIDACAEAADLRPYGVGRARCVDDRLLSDLLNCELNVKKDKAQRSACGCVESVDIGMYNTCKNGCLYCYANYNQKAICGNYKKHNPRSPLLSGEIGADDTIYEREAGTLHDAQLRITI